MTVHLREDLHAGAVLGDPRRTDEHRPQQAGGVWVGRIPIDTAQLDIRLEAPQLAPERVALSANVHQPEMLAVEHDQPRARAQDRRARGRELP